MASQNQDRLRTHFASHPPSSHNTRWNDLWEDGTFLPWDRGHANPALIDLLRCTSSPPPTSSAPNPSPGAPKTAQLDGIRLPSPLKDDGTRSKVLVPGCGTGYDVALFAACGYDAWGLEVSARAVEAAGRYLRHPGEGPLEGEYEVRDEKVGRGSMKCVSGDYFEDQWLQEVDGWDGGFDVIYDNTFLCALPPSLRPRWASRTVSLLAPTGTLACLEFPTHKPATSGGPPWSLPPSVHVELLKRPGEEIQYDDQDVVVQTDRPEGKDALVRIAHYVPKRTHAVGVVGGVVRDCVSLWRHKS